MSFAFVVLSFCGLFGCLLFGDNCVFDCRDALVAYFGLVCLECLGLPLQEGLLFDLFLIVPAGLVVLMFWFGWVCLFATDCLVLLFSNLLFGVLLHFDFDCCVCGWTCCLLL